MASCTSVMVGLTGFQRGRRQRCSRRCRASDDRDWTGNAGEGGDALGGLRKGPDALAALVGKEYGGDPFSGAIYVFRAKRADRIKLSWGDGTGLCLMAKKLEQGAFRWPGIQIGVMRLTAAQFGALLERLDWRRVRSGRRAQVPQIAG